MTTQRLTAAAALHLGIPMTESIDAKVAQPAQAELKSWRDVTDAELESLVGHWGTDSRQACLDLAALLKHKNPSHYIPPSTNIRGEVTDTYIQKVPDKCDRITWRGNYYGLPIAAISTKPVQSSELRVCPRHDYALADENGCTYCNGEKADKPTTPLQDTKDVERYLRLRRSGVQFKYSYAYTGTNLDKLVDGNIAIDAAIASRKVSA